MADNPQNIEITYGGCSGPESMYVILDADEGFEFIIKRKYAEASETLKFMMFGPPQASESESELRLNCKIIPSHVLQKTCAYLTYKFVYTDSHTEIPAFPIAPEMSLELVEAANFLRC